MTDLDRAKRWIEWSNKELKIRELPKLNSEATWKDYLRELVYRKYTYLSSDNSIEVVNGVDREQITGPSRSFSELYSIIKYVCKEMNIKLPTFSEFCEHIRIYFYTHYCSTVRRHVISGYAAQLNNWMIGYNDITKRTAKKIKDIEDEQMERAV